VLHGGKLQQLASPEAVYSRPRTKFVADFMGAANFLPAELADVAGDVAHARYRDHTFSGEAPDNVSGRGTTVWIAVRPEHVRASTRPSDDAPSLPAKVQRSAYRGAYRETTAVLEDGTAIVARLSDDSAGYAAGTDVYLTFDPQATVILAE
jgi:ABC-type Fe3+/spermidine/putrescine transport system ATPase subunit